MNTLNEQIDDIIGKVDRYKNAIDCNSEFAPRKQTEFGIYIAW